LTSAHVLAGSTSVEILSPDHERMIGRIIAIEPRIDLALLEVSYPPANDVSGTRSPQLKALALADRSANVGEAVLSVGHPFGLGSTATAGIVSGTERNYDDIGRPDGLLEEGIWSFIQTDASINVGNSGGPLVSSTGEVLGIATAVRRDGQGLAFAVPAALARRFLEDVAAHGRLIQPRLGMAVETVGSDVVPSRIETVRVVSVQDGGPAQRAGIAPGDLIIRIDGHPIARTSQVAYLAQVAGAHASLNLERRRMGAVPPHPGMRNDPHHAWTDLVEIQLEALP
jgi:S1-C subfamily serine protease